MNNQFAIQTSIQQQNIHPSDCLLLIFQKGWFWKRREVQEYQQWQQRNSSLPVLTFWSCYKCLMFISYLSSLIHTTRQSWKVPSFYRMPCHTLYCCHADLDMLRVGVSPGSGLLVKILYDLSTHICCLWFMSPLNRLNKWMVQRSLHVAFNK